MASYEWISHKGKRILYMDIVTKETASKPNLEEFQDIITRIQNVIEKEPPQSVLSICSVRGGTISPDVTQILKDFTKHNEPFMKMTAVIGAEGLKKAIFSAVLFFTGRKNMVLKNSREEALDWLVQQ